MLLDLGLSDISGEEVISRLRAHPDTATLRVIVLSGESDPERAGKVASLGAAGYLSKPFALTALVELIDGFLPR